MPGRGDDSRRRLLGPGRWSLPACTGTCNSLYSSRPVINNERRRVDRVAFIPIVRVEEFRPVSVPTDQLACLPLPLMPAKGFSWKSTARPLLALLGADLHEQHGCRRARSPRRRWATSRAGPGPPRCGARPGGPCASLVARQQQILGRYTVARNNSNHHSGGAAGAAQTTCGPRSQVRPLLI